MEAVVGEREELAAKVLEVMKENSTFEAKIASMQASKNELQERFMELVTGLNEKVAEQQDHIHVVETVLKQEREENVQEVKGLRAQNAELVRALDLERAQAHVRAATQASMDRFSKAKAAIDGEVKKTTVTAVQTGNLTSMFCFHLLIPVVVSCVGHCLNAFSSHVLFKNSP